MYSFFVVSGDRIVRETVSFHDDPNSSFDPAVFKSESDSDFVWFNDADWREARARFWYRKFYTETRTGQLMVLRPDEPTLHQFQRSQVRDIGLEMQLVTQLKTYRLLSNFASRSLNFKESHCFGPMLEAHHEIVGVSAALRRRARNIVRVPARRRNAARSLI